MVDAQDIILSIIGFFVRLYGGLAQEFLTLTTGILIIFLTITLKLASQEQDVKVLQAQINTQNELKKIREEIRELKNERDRQ